MAEHEERKTPLETLEKPAECVGAGGEIAHAAGASAGTWSPLAMFGGTMNIISGLEEMAHGHAFDGLMKSGKGATEVVATGAELAGNEAVAGRAGMIGVALDAIDAVRKFQKGDYAGGATAGIGAGLSAYNPAVGAAWKAGTTVGTAIDNHAADANVFGDHRSAHQAAADSGVAEREKWEAAGVPHWGSWLHGADVTLGHGVTNTVWSAADALSPLSGVARELRNPIQPVEVDIPSQEEGSTRGQVTARDDAPPRAPTSRKELAKVMKSIKDFQRTNAKVFADLSRRDKAHLQAEPKSDDGEAAKTFRHYAD